MALNGSARRDRKIKELEKKLMDRPIQAHSIFLTVDQLGDLLRAPESVYKDLQDARERLLKLEYKYKELEDVLIEFRAKQVMSAESFCPFLESE